MAYHGKAGKAFFAGVAIPEVTENSYTLTADTADSTAMAATNNGMTRLVGFKRGTASVTAKYSTTPVVVETTAQGTLELLRTSSNAAGGLAVTAQFTGSEIGADKNDVETITYNFRLAGVPSNTVTEGA